jgi:penicillin amidase
MALSELLRGVLSELTNNPLLALARLYRRPLPQVEGTTRLAGIRAPVEILRDKWGVPHIYARSSEDASFAQGYVHAQDRLWQLELNRRVGHGRLSELFGELAFGTDRLLRTIGLGRAAYTSLQRADEPIRELLEAYARGVNAYVDKNRKRLPIEFTLLRLDPEPWQPIDSLAWGQMMAWGLSTNWDSELLNGALIAKLGPERAARLKGEYPKDNPIVLPDHRWAALEAEVIAEFKAAQAWLPMTSVQGMSNNWVVDGKKSVTGKPLLANDPHLGLQMPSIWYENHLVAPDLEVTGVSLPGAPGVVIGHNAHIAWGFTAAVPDTADLFVEKIDPKDHRRYEFQGKWREAQVIREQVPVKGGPARTIEIVITHHGPIVNDLSAIQPSGLALALKWVGHEENRINRAAFKLNRARNWKEFRAALADWDAPSMSAVYADREGNIGYQMTGRVPIRKKGRGQTAVPGWTGEYEWVGTIPADELPSVLNPPQHYLASANNQLTGEGYKHFLSSETMNGFRARRIVAMLGEKEQLAADDFQRMQLDQFCAPAKTFCALVGSLEPALLQQPILQGVRGQAERALGVMRRWDHRLTADSVPGALYELMQHFVARRILEPHLGELTEPAMGVGFHPVLNPVVLGFLDRMPLVIQDLLVQDDKSWWSGRTREELLASALYDAIHYLTTAVGPRLDEWQWGKIHFAAFNHPLGAKKPLDKIFSRGPFPYGGDTHTVWQAAYVPKLPLQAEGGFTASWRQILDLADWDASRAVHTTGQSGHPASPHYDDMIPMWLNGEYHPLLWSRARVEAHLESRLTLEPT